MNQIIPIKKIITHQIDFEKFLSNLLKKCNKYNLPGNPDKEVFLQSISGGADSSALAILMHAMFPAVNFIMVFSDTRSEDPGVYETLSRLEAYLGKSIIRLTPEKGLYELIDQYNGFLPSPIDRWCTRQLKATEFIKWINRFEGMQKRMFVGIRSDESDRIAFTIDDVETEMPFVDMGLKREDIFAILSHTIGIPKFYQRRTRSGCSNCFFQRRSELVGLYQDQPNEFNIGKNYEKLIGNDLDRHDEALPLWKDTGIALNWQSLPLPEKEGVIQGTRPKLGTMDIFGNRGIFIAGEFFMDGMFSNNEFIWHQKIISFSPTLAGIRRQIDDRYRHLLDTGEVYQMSPGDVREKVKFAIWYVELPELNFDPDSPTKGGYTWQKGASYAQLQHIISWATRALHAEGLSQLANSTCRSELSVQYEWKEASRNGLKKIVEPVGQISNSQWYQPTEIVPDLTVEEELVMLPCPMCTI